MDAVVFLAVTSLAAAVVLAGVPRPVDDGRDEAMRYASAVLESYLASTLDGAFVVWTRDGRVEWLPAGPAYQVIARALLKDLEGANAMGLGPRIAGDLGLLVRSDWSFVFTATGKNPTGRAWIPAAGGCCHPGTGADYVTAAATFRLGDANDTAARLTLDLYPAP